MQVQELVNGSQLPTVSPTTYSGPLRVLLLINASGSTKPGLTAAGMLRLLQGRSRWIQCH